MCKYRLGTPLFSLLPSLDDREASLCTLACDRWFSGVEHVKIRSGRVGQLSTSRTEHWKYSRCVIHCNSRVGVGVDSYARRFVSSWVLDGVRMPGTFGVFVSCSTVVEE